MFVTFLDDDDEFTNNRFLDISPYLKDETDIIITGVIKKKNSIIIGKLYSNINNIAKRDLVFNLLNQNSFFFTGSNLILRRDLINKINGFDGDFIRNQDIEFAIRAILKCKKIISINSFSVVKNIDDNSNVPSYEKMKNVKQLFLGKFDKLINEYSTNEIKDIYKSNYYELLKVAYLNKNSHDIKNAIKYLKSKGVYNFFEVKKLRFITFIRSSKIFSKIKELKMN